MKRENGVVKGLHVGPHRDTGGGIASVISELVGTSIDGLELCAYPSWGKSRAWQFTQIVRFVVYLKTRKPDIVHVHLSERGSFVREGSYLYLAALFGVKSVATLHGADFRQFGRKFPRVVRMILTKADRLVALSDDDATFLGEIAVNIPISRLRNPVKIAPKRAGQEPEMQWRHSEENHRSLVLFAGELSYRKGFDVLLSAWESVSELFPKAALLVCGPESDFGSSDLRHASQYYLGNLPRSQVIELLATVDVTCLPSRREVQPMILLESMSLAVPFVSSDAGAWQEMAASGGGLVLRPCTSTAISTAITTLLGDGQEAKRLGKQGREYVGRYFDTSIVLRSHLDLYLALLEPDHQGSG